MLDAFTRGDTADVLVRLDRLSAKLVSIATTLVENESRGMGRASPADPTIRTR